MVKGNALLLLPGAFSGYGGIEKYNRLVIRGFAELEAETGIRPYPLVLNDAPEDVDGRYVPRGAEWPHACGRGRGAFVVQAVKLAVSKQPDLLLFGHVHFARLGPWLRLASPKARHWYVVHGIEAWKRLSRPIRNQLRSAERILSVSEFTRRALVRNNELDPTRVVLQWNAVDPVWQEQYGPKDGEAPPAPPERPTLLSVARLWDSERYKGIDSVLRALPEVAKSVPDVRYVIAGEGRDRHRLEGIAREGGVADRVEFLGPVWPDELARLFRSCTLFAMPSEKEGFGIVYLEAALFARPSLAGRKGGAPEAVEDGVTGFVVDREDIPALASALKRMLETPGLIGRMGEAARRRVLERFTFDSFRRGLKGHLAGTDASMPLSDG